MLNQAARYYPILRALDRRFILKPQILEIGAGPTGLGQFRKVSFVGCDLSFAYTRSPMMPVIASGAALPFKDQSFDVVVSSDVLEHVPSVARPSVIQECLRVTRAVAIFGFPSGEIAKGCDRHLYKIYRHKNLEPPIWLKEHMVDKFPESDLFSNIMGWDITFAANENVRFHSWMMRMEMHRLFNYAMKASIVLAPRLLEALLQRMDFAPYYRQIVVLQRQI